MLTKSFLFSICFACFIHITFGTNYRIWCYTGFKYVIGQEEKDDAQECTSLLGLDNYCYRFTATASVEEVVKLGCSNAICMGIGNTCAKIDFAGVHGTMCCCNEHSYCNSSAITFTFPFLLIAFSFFSILFTIF